QYAYPVKRSEVQFLLPEAISYVDYLTDASFTKVEAAIDSVILVEQAKAQLKGVRLICENIPGYREEPFAPYLVETRPAYLIAITSLYPMADVFLPPWAEQCTDLVVNEWFGKQYRNRSNFRWLLAEASDVLNKKYNDRTKLNLLYQFVHEQAVWDGTYGLFPSVSMDEMVIQKSINKSSMNMLLLALLREDGFKAYPILVNTIDLAPVQQEIPDVNQFNHFVIVVDLGDEAIYLDAGDPSLPINSIDPMVRRQKAILIRNYKGSWVSLPDGEAKSAILVDLRLQPDMSGQGFIKASFEGYDAMSERLLLRNDQTGQYWKDRAAELSPYLRIDSVRYTNVKNPVQPFENLVHFHLTRPKEDSIWITPVFYSFYNTEYFLDSLRTTPIVFPFKMFENIVVNLNLPSELKVVSKPTASRFKLEGQPFVMEYFVTESSDLLQVRCSIRLDKTRFGVADYQSLQIFLSHVLDSLTEPIIIAMR
ncbi:MAG: hypothetical protein OEQ53_21305, partial [Saprospiraceae bacterium]|nr:hypothetical protein [Saprospiraceae bacterium]